VNKPSKATEKGSAAQRLVGTTDDLIKIATPEELEYWKNCAGRLPEERPPLPRSKQQ
jgi:hypothetical protein